MEHFPREMTPAELALWAYEESLEDDAFEYNYSDLLMQSQKLIETLGYPGALVGEIHAHVFPEEQMLDSDPDEFRAVLGGIPAELLTIMMPEMYERATDAWMDDALQLAVGAVSETHENCLCDRTLSSKDPLNDPLPLCEEDVCPITELRDKLLDDISDKEVLLLHAAYGEDILASIEYRIRLVYASQRVGLITPGIAGVMVKVLHDNTPNLVERT